MAAPNFISPTTFYSYAMVVSAGDKIRLYQNGVSVCTTALPSAFSFSSLPNTLFIGNLASASGSVSSRSLDLDSVTIWNRALTFDEISELRYAVEQGATIFRNPAVASMGSLPGTIGGSFTALGSFTAGSASSVDGSVFAVSKSGSIIPISSVSLEPGTMSGTVPAGVGGNLAIRGCLPYFAGACFVNANSALDLRGEWPLASNFQGSFGGPTGTLMGTGTAFNNGYFASSNLYAVFPGPPLIRSQALTAEITFYVPSGTRVSGRYMFSMASSINDYSFYLMFSSGPPYEITAGITTNGVGTTVTFTSNMQQGTTYRVALVYNGGSTKTLSVYAATAGSNGAFLMRKSGSGTTATVSGTVSSRPDMTLMVANLNGEQLPNSNANYKDFRLYATALSLADLNKEASYLRDTGGFAYQPPVVTGVTNIPPSGSGKPTITVTGSSFGSQNPGADLTATLDGSPLSNIAWVSDTRFTAEVANSGTGGGHTLIVTLAGQSSAPYPNVAYATFAFQDPYASLPSLNLTTAAVSLAPTMTATGCVVVETSTGIVYVGGRDAGGKSYVAKVPSAGTAASPAMQAASNTGLVVEILLDPGLVVLDDGKVLSWPNRAATACTQVWDLSATVAQVTGAAWEASRKRVYVVGRNAGPVSKVLILDASAAGVYPAPTAIFTSSGSTANSLNAVCADPVFAVSPGGGSYVVLSRGTDSLSIPLKYGTGDYYGALSLSDKYVVFSSAGIAMQVDRLTLTLNPVVFFSNDAVSGLRTGVSDPTESQLYMISAAGSLLYTASTSTMEMLSRTTLAATPRDVALSAFDYATYVLTATTLYAYDGMGCASATSCAACTAHPNLNCGWCITTSLCTTPNRCTAGKPQLFLRSGQATCPTLTSLPVTAASKAGGTSVTVVGTQFAGQSLSCRFGALAPTTATVASATQLSCLTPASPATGTVALSLVLALEPGTPEFLPLGSFSFYDCAALGADCTSCTSAGKADCGYCVELATCGSAAACGAPKLFAGNTPSCPSVTSVGPVTLGTKNGGTPLTVFGSYFTPSIPTYTCLFGSVGGTTPATPALYATASSVTCATPAVATGGPVPINVLQAGSVIYAASPPTVVYTYVGPTLTGYVGPVGVVGRGALTGGTLVELSLTQVDFLSFTCQFGSYAPTPAARTSNTTLSCHSPAATVAGPVTLSVYVGATEYSSTQLPFTYYSCAAQPTCASCYDPTDRLECNWCGSTQSCFSGPGGACATPMPTPGVCPLLSTALPSPDAATAGNTSVTLVGSNFAAGSTLQCSFSGGALKTPGTRLSSTQVLCPTPARAPGMDFVSLFLLGSQYTTNTIPLTFTDCALRFSCSDCLAAPAICQWCGREGSCTGAAVACPAGGTALPACPTLTDVKPGSGPTAGGTQVVVTSSTFPANSIASAFQCSFDGVMVPATVTGAAQLACSAPAHSAAPASLRVMYSGALFSSSSLLFSYYDCGAMADCGACGALSGCVWCLASQACVGQAANMCAADMLTPTASCPTLTSLVGAVDGSTAGGTQITIAGSKFVASLNYTCLFGSGVETPAAVLSATQLTCATAAGTAGTSLVRVKALARSYASNPVSFSYYACETRFTCETCHDPDYRKDCFWCRDTHSCGGALQCQPPKVFTDRNC